MQYRAGVSSILSAGRFAGVALVVAALATSTSPQAMDRAGAIEAAFQRYWDAPTIAKAEQAVSGILKSGVTFEEALARLRAGKTYSRTVPTGSLQTVGRFPYTIIVPEDYTPDKQYEVRVHLHGGISFSQPVAARGLDEMTGSDQIYVLPAGWRGAMWWSEAQVANLRSILDRVKRDYNVNENMIALAGTSDGGTGSYFMAQRDPTPYSSVLPLIGFIVVLRNPTVQVEGDIFPSNLRNRPFFVVNGGQDHLYPTAMVEPYIASFALRGVNITYMPQPNAEHDIAWWPDVKDEFEAFIKSHPRDPLPDWLTWETSDVKRAGRLHWLVVNELGKTPSDPASMDDLNDFTPPSQIETGLRVNGRTVTEVLPTTNADALGFKVGDVITRMDDRLITNVQELIDALKSHAIGAPVRWGIAREGTAMELSGTFAPTEVHFPTTQLFPRPRPSGRVDVTRTGNRVETVSRGVKSFTLLLSPDQFDFSQPVTVVANGRVAFEGMVKPDVATLMRWAAKDNDRTMLFGAELKIRVQ